MSYDLAVTHNGVVLGGSERRFEFEDNPPPIGDVSWTTVSTTAAFAINANLVRIISCSVRKDNNAVPNMTIQDSSMSMVCDDFEIDNNPPLPSVQ